MLFNRKRKSSIGKLAVTLENKSVYENAYTTNPDIVVREQEVRRTLFSEWTDV